MLKNITFSAEEETIKAAREYAALTGKPLNVLIREVLEEFAQKRQQEEGKKRVAAFRETQRLFENLNFSMGEKLTREEMNERR